jgi:hypothetical protein
LSTLERGGFDAIQGWCGEWENGAAELILAEIG